MKKQIEKRVNDFIEKLERINDMESYNCMEEESKRIDTMVTEMWFCDLMSERTWYWYQNGLREQKRVALCNAFKRILNLL